MRPKLLPMPRHGDEFTVEIARTWVDAINRACILLSDGCGFDAQFTPQGTALRVASQPQLFRGEVTTAIPTGTLATPSTTGRVTLYDWDGANSTAGETGVPVLNSFTLSASIAVGKVVFLGLDNGDLWLVQAEC